MKQIQFKESPIQHTSDWYSLISIRLLNQGWSVVKTPRCQFCTEMSDLCYWRPRIYEIFMFDAVLGKNGEGGGGNKRSQKVDIHCLNANQLGLLAE